MVSLSIADGDRAECRPCRLRGRPDTKVVLDCSTGDLICTACGLVLQERCIDESQEWRNFATEGVESGMRVNERMRGGDKDGVIDSSGQLGSTSMAGGSAISEALQLAQKMVDSKVMRLSSSEQALKTIVSKMKATAASLKLSESISERCVQFVTHLSQKNQLDSGYRIPWYYAVIYLACREEGAGRTLRELAHSGAADNQVSEDEFEKQMRKRVSSLTKALGTELRVSQSQYINPEELMRRFVSRLELSQQVCGPAVHITEQARRFGLLRDRHGLGSTEQTKQCAVIASAIFMVAHLLDVPEKPRILDVAVVARVPENSVVAAYEGLRPHASMVLPEAFKSRVQVSLANLPPARPPPNRQPVVPATKVAALSGEAATVSAAADVAK